MLFFPLSLLSLFKTPIAALYICVAALSLLSHVPLSLLKGFSNLIRVPMDNM